MSCRHRQSTSPCRNTNPLHCGVRMCLCLQLKCTSVLATQAKPTEIKLLHSSALILSFLSNLRADPKTLLSSTFSSLQDLERSFFLWSVACLGCTAWVSGQPCKTLPLSRLLTCSCHPARPQPPITRGECARASQANARTDCATGEPPLWLCRGWTWG